VTSVGWYQVANSLILQCGWIDVQLDQLALTDESLLFKVFSRSDSMKAGASPVWI